MKLSTSNVVVVVGLFALAACSSRSGQSKEPGATAAPAATPTPPPPRTYTIAAGAPITIRTLSDVNTKSVRGGSDFEATLESPLEAGGHTLAKRGALVTGTAVSADQGGRDKGKVSLVLTLKSVHLSNGETVAIQTNQVTQEAKSAGDATKMVTRRPAADIPPETVLTFRLANDISITEKVNL